MQEDLHIEDGSNDRAYFTMVPNIVLNHSSAIDQALYLQMKRYAGEKNGGYCSASRKTLMEKLGVGRWTLNKSIDYLLKHEWIAEIGTRTVQTKGGPQEVKIYKINDIWKLNTEHYKGGARLAPLTSKGALDSQGGGARLAPNKNIQEEEEKTAANAVLLKEVRINSQGEEITTKPRFIAKDNSALYLQEKCYQLLKKESGVLPTTNKGDYFRIIQARKSLKDKDILTMVEDAISRGKAQTLRGILTDREIDIYRQNV